MSCKDNKHHRKKQERFGDSSPTNLSDAHGFLNSQFSTFNFQFSVSQILRFSDFKKTPRGIYYVSLLSSLRSALARLLNAARLFLLKTIYGFLCLLR